MKIKFVDPLPTHKTPWLLCVWVSDGRDWYPPDLQQILAKPSPVPELFRCANPDYYKVADEI